MKPAPFTVGCTSFLIPDYWSANAAFAAGKAANMELLFCELSGDLSDLVSEQEVEDLALIAQDSGLTYSVHLPTDIDLTQSKSAASAVEKISALLERIQPLNPNALVLHVETGLKTKPGWETCATDAVAQIMAACAPFPVMLENIEGENLNHIEPLLAALPAAKRCVDIGHLWKDRHALAPILQNWLPQASHIHLHGLSAAGRDHQPLNLLPKAQLDEAVHALLRANFAGVVTLEVFAWDSFLSSLNAIEKSIERYAP